MEFPVGNSTLLFIILVTVVDVNVAYRDANILPDRTKLFDAAGAFIKGITEYMVRHYYPDLQRGVSSQSPLSARITLTPPPSTPLLAVLSDTTSKLRELDERIHLHSTFRQQRIKLLGWTSNLVRIFVIIVPFQLLIYCLFTVVVHTTYLNYFCNEIKNF